MAENYGFTMNMSGDAAKKLKELGVTITETKKKSEDTAKSMGTEFGKVGHSLKEMAAAFSVGSLAVAGIEKVFDGFKEILNESSKAYQEHIKNLTLMKFAIEDVAKEGGGAFEKLSETAEKATLFAPDKVMAAERYLSQIGLTSTAIDEIIPKLQDFAIASGLDIEEAAKIMARGVMGNQKAVRMYGIEVSKTATAEENLNKIMGALEKRHGAQEEYLKTGVGQLQKLNVDLEKQNEILGKTTIGWDFFWAKVKMGSGRTLAAFFGGLGEVNAEETKQNAEKKVEKILKNKNYGASFVTETYKKAKPYLATYKKEGALGVRKMSVGGESEENIKNVLLYLKMTESFRSMAESGEKIRKDSELAEQDEEKKQERLQKIKELQLDYAKTNEKLNDDKWLNKVLDAKEDELKMQKDLNELKKLGAGIDKSLLDSAYKSSGLTGPSGGLAAAKVININIDTVQKNEVTATDQRAYLDTSKQAVEVIVRELNNISLNSASTM